jgi:hypothetical protein
MMNVVDSLTAEKLIVARVWSVAAKDAHSMTWCGIQKLCQ